MNHSHYKCIDKDKSVNFQKCLFYYGIWWNVCPTCSTCESNLGVIHYSMLDKVLE